MPLFDAYRDLATPVSSGTSTGKQKKSIVGRAPIGSRPERKKKNIPKKSSVSRKTKKRSSSGLISSIFEKKILTVGPSLSIPL
ncbi:hypothetical protein PGTUg99_020247 [Puccinia graminis f. sp. tritici]|uniref:Uncharacterized protein n=1 Tax=Puccinia graminis f. sp. tritici TaxID=56615 RepID=A0A5B0S428_PUCGR|nr:hypothetical protein PGTUg99_020247 [Puccinia graminis f. sp. tritici]